MSQNEGTPAVIDPAKLSGAIKELYDNRSLSHINDHEIRMSVMTEPFAWHFHPDSDETFLVVEGELIIEFEKGAVSLSAGQMLTVPRRLLHRTRPAGARSVNLTFEKVNAETVFA
jgi:mannose-6-phosphate isomerase-like protein (cupin superfamily)